MGLVPTINDYIRYTDLMRNGFYDKLFFVDKLFDDWKTLIDFGCADGFITNKIKEVYPEKTIIGYDKDADMIKVAMSKYPSPVFFSSIDTLNTFAKGDVLYLSSIIHEIYSYMSADEIDAFWNYVFTSGFKYIIIRDMIYNEGIQRESHINEIRKVYKWCQKNHCEKHLKEFERFHGEITEYKNLIHFLLKYKYTEGWDREVRENYLPLSIQHLYELIPLEYRIEYSENYTLPFFKHDWEKEMGLFIDEKIHSKFIIKKV